MLVHLLDLWLHCSILLCARCLQHRFLCSMFLCITDSLVSDARDHLPDYFSKRSIEVEEEQRVEADVHHAQQQRRLLPQKQPPLGLTICDVLGLGQRVRRPHSVVGNKAEYVGQRHDRYGHHHSPGVHPEFGVAATVQEPFESQTAEDEHGGGGVEEQRRAEEDGQGVPVEADVLLQMGTLEVLTLLKAPSHSHG